MATCPKCRVTYPDSQTTCPTDGEGLLPDIAFAGADTDLAPGTQVGEYVVEDKLGEGGFGAVFKAAHPLIGKQVAIKVLNRQFSSNPQMVSRFIAEARAVNQIRHRNIIDIFAFGQLPDGRQYYVMELLTGQTLDHYLAARGRLSLAEAVPILRAVARALDAAHAKGIAHRDLKPENVFIGEDDDGAPFPKLLDFGIAKLLSGDAPHQHKTRTGAPMGTPYYMSPEQCRGRDVDHRTDIYSFGIMAYQLLTGTLPFNGQDFMEILLKQLSEAPVLPSQLCPDLPASIDRGILWMMEKDPANRPPNLVTGVRALEEAAADAGLAMPAGPATATYQRQVTPAVTPSGVVAAQTPARITPQPMTSQQAAQVASMQTIAADGAPKPNQSFIAAEAKAAPPRKGKTGLVVAMAGVLAVGGVGAAIALGGGKKKGDSSAAAKAPDPAPEPPRKDPDPPPRKDPDPPPRKDPEPPPPAATVTITIEGAPDGTEVSVGGKPVGKTPGPITLPRGDAPVKLELEAKGYKARAEEVVPSADRVLRVRLEKEKKVVKKKPKCDPNGDIPCFDE